MTRAEIDEMLLRADKARLTLRRATLELVTCGQQIFADRDRQTNRDGSGSH